MVLFKTFIHKGFRGGTATHSHFHTNIFITQNRQTQWRKNTAVLIIMIIVYLSGIYLFKVNNGNTRAMREICSKWTKNTPDKRRYCVFIVNFEEISHTADFAQVNAGLMRNKHLVFTRYFLYEQIKKNIISPIENDTINF